LPNCEPVCASVFAQPLIGAFDREVELGHAELETDLAELTRENLLEYASRFVCAYSHRRA
jgi:hypothetical protein